MKYKTKPYDHQLQAIEKAKDLDQYALFFEAGTGKTKTLIDLLRLRYNENKGYVKTLILAPLVTLDNWKNEFKIHSDVDLNQILVLNKTGAAGLKQLANFKGSIIVMNYDKLQSDVIMTELIKFDPKIVTCDESHIIKNPKSKRAKQVIRLGDNAAYRYCLTGTPILNSPMDIFNQFRFLDKGATFGVNFFVFRNKYFIDENARWANRSGHFPKYVPITAMFPELNEKIYRSAMRVKKDECLDLPKFIKETQLVPMAPEQAKHYKQMKKEFITFIESKQADGEPQAAVAQLAITKALRLMQIASGYVKTEAGEEIQIKNHKIEALELLTKDIVPDNKLIVWCSYKNNYTMISKMLEKNKINHTMLTGAMNGKQKAEAIDTFRNDPACRVIVANRKSGGIGINLIEAAYSIVYSRNFSLEEEIQSEARNYRSGSEMHEKIVKIDLVTKDSIEEQVLEKLRGKEQLSASIIDIVRGE